MANKIQIKRTTVTGRTPNTTDPANTRYIDAGELSLNLTDGKLFSSDGSVYFEVGGNLQSLSVSSSFTANSTRVNSAVNTSIRAIIANGSIGTDGQALLSNATGIYWGTVSGGSAPGGSNTQVQFNDGGSTLGGSAGFSFDKTTNNVSIANTLVTSSLSSATAYIGTFLSSSIEVFNLLNLAANAAITPTYISISNTSSRANLTPTTLAIGSITVNSALANLQALNVVNQTNTGTLFVTTSANVGTAFTTNSTLVNAVALNVVNQTNTATLFVTTSANVGTAAVINSTGLTHTGFINAAGSVNSALLKVGTSATVNSTLANLAALNVVNQTNTATLYVTTSANVGTSLTVNSTAINAAVNTSIRAIIANGSIGTAGQALLSNATGIYWGTVTGGSANPGGSDTQVQFNDGGTTFGGSAGFTFNKTTNNVSLGNTITVGTTATVNGSLANIQALNVVNQTNTATLYVTTSANVGTAAVINSIGITHTGFANVTGVVNASSHIVGATFIANATTIAVGNSTINTTANSTVILVNGVDRVATQKRSIAMSMIFGR